jgi:hypothetical protein
MSRAGATELRASDKIILKMLRLQARIGSMLSAEPATAYLESPGFFLLAAQINVDNVAASATERKFKCI